MKYAEEYEVSRAGRKYKKAGRTFTSGKPAEMERCSLYPANPDVPTVTPTSTCRKNSN